MKLITLQRYLVRDYDYLIIGSGIIGMTIAYELRQKKPNSTIAIIDKENDVAQHASGRNSGVLHAGFYYSADSLKAQFTVEGNRRMKSFCLKHNIYVKDTKKIVVAKNKDEISGIFELHKRAQNNGVITEIIDESRVNEIDPNIKTFQFALFSPSTASVDPKEVCYKLKEILLNQKIDFYFDTPFKKCKLTYNFMVNAAGAYADKIAHQYDLGKNYTMLPFKGIYLKYTENKTDIKTNIYPVPNLANPFLGVHYTITSDGSIKIGPTAIPAFWRENYQGWSRFNLFELFEILFYETKLFLTNAFNFRTLALNEMKNYYPPIFIRKARDMVYNIGNKFTPIPAGVRAQLLNTNTNELVQDFVIEETANSIHILNAVSPAFTCSFAFAEYVVDKIIKEKEKNVK